jgi:CelD/BcsL family acetyltransferase involved in cellulose biosynthesis
MHVQVFTQWDEFNQLRSEWDAVYAADPEAQMFLSWQWLSAWLTVYPSPWMILAVKSDEAASGYVAFLPIRNQMGFDSDVGFYNHLSLAGANYSDYTGIIVRPEVEGEAIRALTKHVKRELNWGRFSLENLLMSDRRKNAFLSAFDKPKFTRTPIDYHTPDGTDHAICPSIDLPGSWDDYLDSLSSNNRQKIRRLMRKVDASKEYRIVLSDGESCDRNLKTLLDFWKIKWAPIKGDITESLVANNYKMLTHCAENGTLLLPVFYEGDRPVAVHAIVVDTCKRSQLFLITGRDETYDAMPAGYLLHAYMIQRAIALGFSAYDFCKGDESYKYLFGVSERRLSPVEVHTASRGNLQDSFDPFWIPTMLGMALDSEQAGKSADAELGYRQIVKAAPDNALALFRLGRFVAKTGAHDEAKRLLTRSVEVEPEGDNAWFWLARSLQALGEKEAAKEACRKVIALKPDNEEAKQMLLQLSFVSKPVPEMILLTPSPMEGFVAPAGGRFDPAEVLSRLEIGGPRRKI